VTVSGHDADGRGGGELHAARDGGDDRHDHGGDLTATVTVAPKTYDGLLSATLARLHADGVVSGDDVHCTGGTAAFDSAVRATGSR
jgi:hypothetical protein